MVKTFCVDLQINVLMFSFTTHFYAQQSELHLRSIEWWALRCQRII